MFLECCSPWSSGRGTYFNSKTNQTGSLRLDRSGGDLRRASISEVKALDRSLIVDVELPDELHIIKDLSEA